MYQYWEDFINAWNKGGSYSGWTNPDSIPLYNNPDNKDLSSIYLPEPWWGNDGTPPLHSVVINFNPGEGGPSQERGKIRVSSYSKDVVNNPSVLSETRKWHWNNRAKPLLEILQKNGFITGNVGLDNHLSIELVLWHTKGVSNALYAYIENNIIPIYEHSICFAANESRRIANTKLNSVVILKMSESATKLLLCYLNKIGISSSIVKPTIMSGRGKSIEFAINSLSGVRFVSIWGTSSRNNFPSHPDLDNIIIKHI